LCDEKGFAESRIEGAIKKLKAQKGTQPRLEAFFGKPTIVKSSMSANKNEEKNKKSLKKK
jgi:hypothetical protein